MKISGHVDLCGPELIEGWLYCDAWDGEPIKLQVFVGNELLGECNVDRFRNDLQEAGFGDGRFGFSFTVPEQASRSSFAATKLRVVDTPVFLLPDEFSRISGPSVSGKGTVVGLNEASELEPCRRLGGGLARSATLLGKHFGHPPEDR